MTFSRIGLFVCLLAVTGFAQLTTLTQNSSSTLQAGSVSCNASGFHNTSSYWREYFPAAHGIASPVFLWGANVGVEIASSSTGLQPVVLNFYSNPTPPLGGTPIAALIPLASEAFSISDTTLTLESLRFTMPFPAYSTSGTDSLVVEFQTPASGASFFIGSNSRAQSGPSYLWAPSCGTVSPTDLTILGQPLMHIVLDILVDPTNQVLPLVVRDGTSEDLLLRTAAGGAPPNGLQNKAAAATGNAVLEIELTSPSSTFSTLPFIVILQLASPAQPFIDVGAPVGSIWLSSDTAALTGGYGNDPTGPLGLPPLLGAGNTRILVLQPLLAGLNLGIQGVSLAGGAAANGIFASTDHHVITLF